MKATFNQLTTLILLSFLFILCHHQAHARIYYVNIEATGSNNGSSWQDAFINIQDAIDAALAGDSIWVADGEYLPTFLNGEDTLRSRTFYINKAISLFGGFAGIPGTEGNFSEQNPKANRTVLSGDVGVIVDQTDNVFHVMYVDHVPDSLLIDGFVIAFGNGNGASGFDAFGAGLYNDASAGSSNPVLRNIIFCENITSESGGGMMNYAAEGGNAMPKLLNCKFDENKASGGGGISNYSDNGGNASPILINCLFIGNEALTAQGGAMISIGHSAVCAPVLINCIVIGNNSPTSAAFVAFVTGTGIATTEIINSAFSGNTGGSIRIVDLGEQNSSVKIRNSILWGNAGGTGISLNGAAADVMFSVVEFGFSGEGNIAADPMFVSQPQLDGAHTEGDLHLQENSPAIDAGNNALASQEILTDFDLLPRFVNPTSGLNGTIDIGPYEIQTIATGIHTLSGSDWNVFPTVVNNEINITLATSHESVNLSIIDQKGQIISSHELKSGVSNFSIDLSSLAQGIYYIHMLMDGVAGVKKIIVHAD